MESALKTWPSTSPSPPWQVLDGPFPCVLSSLCSDCQLLTPTPHPLLWEENQAGLFHGMPNRLNHYLHHVDEVQKKFLGILLSVSGKFWVPLSNEGLKHAWSNAILHTLQITMWKRKVVTICQACVLARNTLLLAMLFFRWQASEQAPARPQKGFSLLCHIAYTIPQATHASRGCCIQASPSDQTVAPHLQKLALNTPRKAVHGPVWLWNDKVTVRISISSISHAPGATLTHPALTLP